MLNARRIALAILATALLLVGSGQSQTTFTELPWDLPECGGSALGDYDNDGWPDAFRTECRGYQVALMHNNADGSFAPAGQTESVQAALPPGKRLGYGQTFADYDNDGDLDLFIAVGMWDYGQRARNVLLRNDRGRFVDVTEAAGLTDISNTDNVVWFDYDRDGYLDLYLGNPGCGAPAGTVFNVLYRNEGDGTFRDATAEADLAVGLGDPAVVGGCDSGSNGGLVGGDFNGDGWPDLYVAVFRAPNRLFLNDGRGHFRDASTPQLADPGQAFDVAVGDIDNDGDLDLFQATGGLGQDDRSLLLLNLGDGQWANTSLSAGIDVTGNAEDTGFGDIDNDGDLDLALGRPRRVYLNDGHGVFTEVTDQAVGQTASIPVAFWDYDLDGQLDGQGYTAYHRNNGSTNHWLRVELVGIRSNRNGINARVVATAGEVRQMREILGGRGFNEDELVAHFGLGARTQVDRLEIRWPSGQVDVLTEIPADQKIRVTEGRPGYYPVQPSLWVRALPDTLVAGQGLSASLAVRPALYESGARITRVVADLSSLGGPAELPLQARSDGTWDGAVPVKVASQHGYRSVAVLVDQETSLGSHWAQLSQTVLVLPAADQMVSGASVGDGWQLGPTDRGDPQKLGFLAYHDGAWNIHLVNQDGSNEVRLTQSVETMVATEDFGLYQYNWDWSPDGRQIVAAGNLGGVRALYQSNADGTGLRQLTYPPEGTHDWEPAWSPDGRRIAFASTRNGSEDIYLIDADGTGMVQLTSNPAMENNPSWSPDGRRIAFEAAWDEAGLSDLWAMDADGANVVRLTSDPGIDWAPAWSPDGRRIAFNSDRGRAPWDFRLWVMDADGSNPQSVQDLVAYTASWSADATKIACWSGGGMVVLGLDGTPPVRVLRAPGWESIPNWFPSGVPSPLQVLNDGLDAVTYQGRQARRMQSDRLWLASYQPKTPLARTGYVALAFAFHPGDGVMPADGWLSVRVNDHHVDLLRRVDLTRPAWQEVQIPMAELALTGPIERLDFSGVLKGTFYLADLRWVTAASLLPPTVVTEDRGAGLPPAFSLAPSYPNPFNSTTVIRFALARAGAVELALYNLTGQRLAQLVRGPREAGTYTVTWDGRDGQGRPLASGVYLCELRAGDYRAVRRMVLTR